MTSIWFHQPDDAHPLLNQNIDEMKAQMLKLVVYKTLQIIPCLQLQSSICFRCSPPGSYYCISVQVFDSWFKIYVTFVSCFIKQRSRTLLLSFQTTWTEIVGYKLCLVEALSSLSSEAIISTHFSSCRKHDGQ